MSNGARQRERDFKQWYVKIYPNGENTAKTYSSKLKNIVDKMPDTLQKKLKSNLFEYDDAEEFESVKNVLSSSTDFVALSSRNHSQERTAMTQYLSFLRERSGDVDNNGERDLALHKKIEFVPPVVISDEKVFINGNEYRLYRKEDETVQDFIRSTTEKLLKTNSISTNEISNLLDKRYCQGTFGLQHPFFVRTDSKRYDNAGYARYYAKKSNGQFYICREWWKDNFEIYERKFAAWLKKLSQHRNISSANHVEEHNSDFQQNKKCEQTSVTYNETVKVSAEEYKEFLAWKNSQQKTVVKENTSTTENIYNALKNMHAVRGGEIDSNEHN